MSNIVVLVLRSGGDFDWDYVDYLSDCIHRYLKHAEIIVLTDMEPPKYGAYVTLPLWYNWPGWWSKMEIFRPGIVPKSEPFLYMDLDTMLVKDIDEFFGHDELITANDWSRPHGINSTLMFLPGHVRPGVWQKFALYPEEAMERHAKGGDQEFLTEFWSGNVKKWDQVLPGKVASYKWNIKPPNTINPEVAVIAFHGKPRPRDISWTLPQS